MVRVLLKTNHGHTNESSLSSTHTEHG